MGQTEFPALIVDIEPGKLQHRIASGRRAHSPVVLHRGCELCLTLAKTEKQKAENGSKKADSILKVSQAKSMIGGDNLDIKSAYAACGLEDVEIEEPDDDLVNPDEPETVAVDE